MKILGSFKPELKNPRENPLKRYLKRDDLIIVLRHGRIEGGEEKRYIGVTDVKLDSIGLKQAEYWRNILADINISRIFSSSLARCIDTVKVMGFNEFQIDNSINEINLGVFEGLSMEFVKKKMKNDFEERGRNLDTFRPVNGESFNDLKKRTVPFWNDIVKLSGNILVVTHAGVIRVLLSTINKTDIKNIFSISVDYGELFIFDKI